jgi:hypothetical protein
MRSTISIVVAGLLVLAITPAAAQTFDFETAQPGTATDCRPGLTGGGLPVDWQVMEDADAPAGPKVVAEVSGDRTNNRFSLCILPGEPFADGSITVAFKPVSGTVDQAAGVMLRVADEDNYYVARANALEGNTRFYRVVGGRREQLASADTPLSAGEWHILKLSAEGASFRVELDGTEILSAGDETFATAGGTGIWTKADSLTHFDAIEVSPNT